MHEAHTHTLTLVNLRCDAALDEVLDEEGETFLGSCADEDNPLDQDSPKASDCIKAADNLPHGDCTQSGSDTCFTLENSGTCEILICGAKNFKTDCSSVSVMIQNIAADQTSGCTATSGSYKGQTQGKYHLEDDENSYITIDNGNTATPDEASIGNADGASFSFKGNNDSGNTEVLVAVLGPAPAPAPALLKAPNAAPAPV